MVKKVEVVPYNPDWIKQYEAEAQKIQNALGENLIAVHHIGSTSVPKLAAKNILDILVVVENIQDSQLLQNVGYNFRCEINIPLRYYFTKNSGTKRVVNLHACEKDNNFIELNLYFRDFLINHPKYRDEYQRLKYKLLDDPQASIKQKGHRFTKYNLGKDQFINKVILLSKFDGLRFVFCTHYTEWEAAKKYRKEYFFDLYKDKDSYTWSFDHEDHKHFILYKGINIIGYAHIQLLSENRAKICVVFIDKKNRKKGYGTKFIQLIEKWLKLQEYRNMYVQSSFSVLNFYERLNYTKDFNCIDHKKEDDNTVFMSKVI